ASTVTVLRVESPSPDQAGAEYCSAQGKECAPIAPQQKLPMGGIVRTFAGGKVSLDFGAGRRVDLDSLSETVLTSDEVKLQKGQFTLESKPLVEKEEFSPLSFTLAGKKLSSLAGLPTTASVAVADDEALLTVRKGSLQGL